MKDLAQERSRKKQVATRKLATWTFLWTAFQAVIVFGGLLIWPEQALVQQLTVILGLLFGVFMIAANRQHFQSLDELERTIQLEAMALTLGLTLIVGIAYSNLDILNIIPFDAEISYLVLFMGITYAISLGLNTRRYQ